jgi:hypothetical protein
LPANTQSAVTSTHWASATFTAPLSFTSPASGAEAACIVTASCNAQTKLPRVHFMARFLDVGCYWEI